LVVEFAGAAGMLTMGCTAIGIILLAFLWNVRPRGCPALE